MKCPRVYVNIGRTYYDETTLPAPPNFVDLIDKVAYCKKKYTCKGHEVKLINWRGRPSRHRTKKYIVRETNKLIHRMQRFQCDDENMAARASPLQIKNLETACHYGAEEGRISGYALVILYVIYRIIRDVTTAQDDTVLQQTANYINALVERYYEYNRADRVAHFLVESYDPVSRTFLNRDQNMPGALDFPPIPRERVVNG